MDIKQELHQVIDAKAGYVVKLDEAQGLCQRALARIVELETGSPATLAQLGGQSKSVQKRLAAQTNGRKGGRPRKT